MKVTSDHFRCDLCGKYSNLGVTESFASSAANSLRVENTVCVRCIRDALVLLVDGLLAVTSDSTAKP